MSEIDPLLSSSGNFAGLPPQFSDFKNSKVTILPVPYDTTAEWHSGSREGPASIIEASYFLEWYDIELDKEPFKVGINTLPEMKPVLNGPENMSQNVYQAVRHLLQRSKFVVMLGGEHSISLGAVRAYKEKYPACSVLQLDAHLDLRDEYLGTKYGQASVMRRIIELCPITQVGIRSMSSEEKEFVSQNNLKPFFIEQGHDPLSPERIVDSLKQDVYITIDLDVFDPSIMPAVGTPEPGGLLWHQVISLLKTVAERRNVIGFDVVELCPVQSNWACSYTAAKLIYKLIGYCL